jgi:hypothetical protein
MGQYTNFRKQSKMYVNTTSAGFTLVAGLGVQPSDGKMTQKKEKTLCIATRPKIGYYTNNWRHPGTLPDPR